MCYLEEEMCWTYINPYLFLNSVYQSQGDIRGLAIKYSSELRKHENENIKNIEKELNSLEALYESMDSADLNIETKLLTLKLKKWT
jgi:hypothetical protein